MLLLQAGVCALPNITSFFFCRDSWNTMLAIRVYISLLTLAFLFLAIGNRGLGMLEALVITCAIVYLILDVRTDLQSSKNELRLLENLEKQVSLLLR
jgi:NADH:ubiquinone oxidoreductase subunit 6 (subunit J)